MATRDERFAMQIRLLSPSDGCDPSFALAVGAFRLSLLPSHSLASRRYSIRSLFRRHLDDPFGRTLKWVSRWPDLRRLLPNHLSDVLSDGPINQPEFPSGHSDSTSLVTPSGEPGEQVAVRLTSLVSAAAGASRPSSVAEVDWRVQRIAIWDQNFRLAIRGIREKARKGEIAGRVCKRVCGSLDTARRILDVVRLSRPRRGMDPDFGCVADERRRRPSETFCELCWRVSIRTDALKKARWPWPVPARIARLSDRFCAEHNPSDHGSRYRADLYYKEAFHKELASLELGDESQLWLQFGIPHGADQQEIRKTAYDAVHSGLVPVRSKKPEIRQLFRERVFALWREGASQSAIARELGVSRQAVSKALKNLRQLLEARSREAEVSPTTGEARVAASKLLAIHSLGDEGKSVAEIAREVGHLKHTVRTSLIRRGRM